MSEKYTEVLREQHRTLRVADELMETANRGEAFGKGDAARRKDGAQVAQ